MKLIARNLTHKTSLLCFVVILLLGCNLTNADTEQANQQPSSKLDATHSQYQAPKDERQDCLGRLVFATPTAHEWALEGYHPEIDRSTFNGPQFGQNMATRGAGGISVGDLKIHITQYAKKEYLDDKIQFRKLKVSNAIKSYKKTIEMRKRRKKEFEETLKNANEYTGSDDLSTYPIAIKDFANNIKNDEAAILDIQQNNEEIDLGIPDSRGFRSGGVFTAYIYHDGYLFNLEFSTREGQYKTQAERKAAFFKQLRSFRPRQMNEIPTTPGICIPHGFFADEDDMRYNLQATMRFKDQPGVTYSISSGVLSEYSRLPNSGFITAGISALSAGADGKAKKRIGPRTAYIGSLPASQGGVIIASENNPNTEFYDIYTAFDGQENSQALPFIHVHMRNYLMSQEPTLKKEPPPYAVVKPRFEHFLDSIRLRPTPGGEPILPPPPAITNQQHVDAVYAKKAAQEAAEKKVRDKKAEEKARKQRYNNPPLKICKPKPTSLPIKIDETYTPWIISTNYQPEGMGLIRSENELARGESNDKGEVIPTEAETKKIIETLCTENKTVWLSYPNHAINFKLLFE